ncbi:MAG: hypothetical protein HY815_24135, partial [Candidatus Riflebacteria bacterium]|nr:hypothetical protein [Candidatus Riflebacteria bacterium]
MRLCKAHGVKLFIVGFLWVLVGCGSDPGGDFIVGDIKNSQLPIAGAQKKLQEAFDLFKNGAYTQAREGFLKVLGDQPSPTDRAEALAGVGFCDVRLKGSQDGIAEFEQALATDSKNQDARVGLAGALISRGSP